MTVVEEELKEGAVDVPMPHGGEDGNDSDEDDNNIVLPVFFTFWSRFENETASVVALM